MILPYGQEDGASVCRSAIRRQLEDCASGVVLIGVCGLPGAGKTTLCRDLLAQSEEDEALRGRLFHYPCDLFARWGFEERERLISAARASGEPARIAEMENPLHWYHWEVILEAWQTLRETRSFSYSHAWNKGTGELTGAFELTLPSEGPVVILCDGIYLLHSPVREALSDCWYLQTPVEMTIARALHRGGWNEEKERVLLSYHRPYFEKHESNPEDAFLGEKR